MNAAIERVGRLRSGLRFAGFGDMEAALFTEGARFTASERPWPAGGVPLPILDEDRRRYLLALP